MKKDYGFNGVWSNILLIMEYIVDWATSPILCAVALPLCLMYRPDLLGLHILALALTWYSRR